MKVIWPQCGNLAGAGGGGAEVGAQVSDRPGHPHSGERVMQWGWRNMDAPAGDRRERIG